MRGQIGHHRTTFAAAVNPIAGFPNRSFYLINRLAGESSAGRYFLTVPRRCREPHRTDSESIRSRDLLAGHAAALMGAAR